MTAPLAALAIFSILLIGCGENVAQKEHREKQDAAIRSMENSAFVVEQSLRDSEQRRAARHEDVRP